MYSLAGASTWCSRVVLLCAGWQNTRPSVVISKHLRSFIRRLGATIVCAWIAAAESATQPACEVHSLSVDRGGVTLHKLPSVGQPVVVEFWASWCAPCVEALAVLAEAQPQLTQMGIEVIAINLDDDPNAARTFLQRHPLPFAQWGDAHALCSQAFAVDSLPVTFIVDPQAQVRTRIDGLRREDLPRLLRAIESSVPNLNPAPIP